MRDQSKHILSLKRFKPWILLVLIISYIHPMVQVQQVVLGSMPRLLHKVTGLQLLDWGQFKSAELF